ncbi:MAG: hypothetical protein AB1486_07965 [Planctomycetota bacterium]
MRPNGKPAKGEAAHRERAHEERSRAEATRREFSLGELSRGELSRGEPSRGELTRGELTRGEVTPAEATRGEPPRGELLSRMKPSSAALRDLCVLYEELDRELVRAAPLCRARGLCCDFTTSDHRLYATALEVALVHESGLPELESDPRLCPFFVDRSCHARSVRPLGCRLYFCDASWPPRMETLSTDFHERLRRLHERHEVPYHYELFVDAVRRR